MTVSAITQLTLMAVFSDISAIPYRIEAHKVLDAIWWSSIMATGGLDVLLRAGRERFEMHLNDPSVYMRMRGYTGAVVLECAACPTQFQAKDGVAFPAVQKDGDV